MNTSYAIEDLGVYVLPGRVTDPRPGIGQALAAERAGFGSVWVAERWDRKEIGVVCGALGQATSRVRIVAGMTHFGSRHPIVLAGLGTTMQALTGGRFRLGVARSSPEQWTNLGLTPPSNAALADHATLMRRLWAGETIDYAGPAGRYPNLCLGITDPTPPPLLLAAIGPKTLALAGRYFDGAVLHPFLTVQGVARSVKVVRRAAEEAGRDPERVSIVATVVVAPDLSMTERLLAVEARAVTYFSIPDVAGAILRMNDWDAAPVEVLLSNPQLAGLEFQRVPHAEFIDRISKVASQIPPAWAAEGAAVGTARECAARLRAYRDAGVNELLLHGTTADRLTDVLREYSLGPSA